MRFDIGALRAWQVTWRGLLHWRFERWSRIDRVCGGGFRTDAVTGEMHNITPSTTPIKGPGFAIGPVEFSK